MNARRWHARVAALLLGIFLHGAALAQAWPAGPIRIVVTTNPGDLTDLIPRLMQPRLSELLGQPIIIENRPGANGAIAAGMVKRSAPDGHTILFTVSSTITLLKHTVKGLDYDPVKDFAPITALAGTSGLLLAHPSFPAATFPEFLAHLKQQPGKVLVGTAGQGGFYDIVGEMLKKNAGVDFLQVHYKGPGPAFAALVSGEVGVSFVNAATAMPLVKAGKLKILAGAGSRRTKALPEVPTIGEFVPSFALATSWLGFLGPSGMPQPVVERLHAELIKAADTRELREKMENLALEWIGNTPEQARARVAQDLELNRRMVAAAGITP